MQKLRKLAVVAALSVTFAVTAFADGTAPCAPPEPGQTNTPPCAMAQVAPEDSVAPSGTTVSSPSNNGTECAVTEITLDLIESILLLF